MRRRLLKKYNLYYTYWIDFSILTCIFAITGLLVAAIEWEVLYPERESGTKLAGQTVFTGYAILSNSIFGVLSIVIKYRM